MYKKAEIDKIDKYIEIMLNILKEIINPKKIMIFGSYVYGKPNEDSDLDLLIVIDKDEIPKNYDEKLEIKAEIRKLIRDINKKIAIDLIVFTVPEYQEFINSNSSFSREILEKGKILYEKAS